MLEPLDHNSEQEIRSLLEGRRIVGAETGVFDTPAKYDTASGRLTLDDGTQLLVVPNSGGCSCGGGDYELEHLATVDNIITDVRVVCEEHPEYWDLRYRIYVVADAVEINVLSVEGNDGSGYYGTGFELYVIPASTNESE